MSTLRGVGAPGEPAGRRLDEGVERRYEVPDDASLGGDGVVIELVEIGDVRERQSPLGPHVVVVGLETSGSDRVERVDA